MTRFRARLFALLLAICTLWPVTAQMAATGTPMPAVFQTILDSNGNPIAGCVWSYASGTSTQIATYTDYTLSAANTQPIVADSSGRFVGFLVPGTSYKFVFESTPCSASSHGSVIRTVDGVSATPGSSAGIDITVTAGESLAAGNAVYVSDGSGGKTAGLAYLATSANAYSSSIAGVIGMVPNAIASAAAGTLRIGGTVTGLTSLTPGAKYYASTAGGITSTAPSAVRFLGTADTTSSLILEPEAAPLTAATGLALISTGTTSRPTFQTYNNSVCDCRLTLTSGTAITTADVTGATNVYLTPYRGNRIALYDGSANWAVLSFSEVTQALGTLTSALPYDVFAYNNSGVVATELLAWTNATTRATALVLQDGVLVKSGATTRKYLGTFYTTATTTTEDSVANRYLWNMYNRVDRPFERYETTGSWTYNVNTIRQANASPSNQVNVLIGVSEDPIVADLAVTITQATGTNNSAIGFGLDSTTAFASNQSVTVASFQANVNGILKASYTGFPGVGKHTLTWLEDAGTTVTTTFYGSTVTVNAITIAASSKSGFNGRVKG